jgi:predicted ATPase
MISKVSIRNFKCLRDVTVDLERFTVLVGPNASGKSSILQGLNGLCQLYRVDHPQQQLETPLHQYKSRGAAEEITLACVADDKWYRYRTNSSAHPRPPGPSRKDWAGDGRGVGNSLEPNIDLVGWAPWKQESPNRWSLPHSVLLRLETSKIVQTAPGTAESGVMSPDGAGLHTALANMALNDPDSWQALQADLRQIIPTIRRLRHTRAATPHQPSMLLFDAVGADSLPAHHVSEGTLLVLGLLGALYAPERPGLVLLDDLDRGLHPKAQKELIELLRRLQAANPELQIIATTHSPYMLDCMGTKEVRVTFQKDDGATVCSSLVNHPQFTKWKSEMTPGEMWSLFGEKWLAERGATT